MVQRRQCPNFLKDPAVILYLVCITKLTMKCTAPKVICLFVSGKELVHRYLSYLWLDYGEITAGTASTETPGARLEDLTTIAGISTRLEVSRISVDVSVTSLPLLEDVDVRICSNEMAISH